MAVSTKSMSNILTSKTGWRHGKMKVLCRIKKFKRILTKKQLRSTLSNTYEECYVGLLYKLHMFEILYFPADIKALTYLILGYKPF
jgi:hypothetical protein